jgi:phosphate:Na+ symporter
MRELAFLIEIAGEAALLLWGLHMVQTGVQRSFGSRLRAGLGLALGSKRRAFLAGLATTAVLQSSTATALMVTSFAAAGGVALAPALAAMAGANLGTALLVQALSFDTGPLASALVLAGVTMFRRGRQTRLRDFGRVAIGLGLMLLSLHLMTVTLSPIEASPGLRLVLEAMAGNTLFFVVAAALLAWAAHSSVAAVLFVASLAASGAIGLEAAQAMVLGANLGSALNPLLEAGGQGAARLRVPLGNLLNRVGGVVLGLAALPWLAGAVAALDATPAHAVALTHLGFNLATALLALPLLPGLARLLERALPEPPPAADAGAPRHLDSAALDTPSVALAQAQREVLRLADMVEDRLAQRGTAGGEVTHRLQAAIAAYLGAIRRDAMSKAEEIRAADLLHFATALDHTMLALEADLLRPLARWQRRGGGNHPGLLASLQAQLRLAFAVMVMEDAAAARSLVRAKEELRGAEAGEGAREVTRGVRVVSGQIASIAHPLLRRRGELLPTRLVEPDVA